MRQRFGGESMRKVIEPRMEIGEIAIPDIQIDLQSRDEIPKVLIGLRELYCERSLRYKVFEALKYLVISFPASLSPGLQPGDSVRRVANPP